jgi:hypothetical protein
MASPAICVGISRLVWGRRDLSWKQPRSAGSRGELSAPSSCPERITPRPRPLPYSPDRACGTRLDWLTGLAHQMTDPFLGTQLPNRHYLTWVPFRKRSRRFKNGCSNPREGPSRRVLAGFRIDLGPLGAPPEPRPNNLSGSRLRRPQLQFDCARRRAVPAPFHLTRAGAALFLTIDGGTRGHVPRLRRQALQEGGLQCAIIV